LLEKIVATIYVVNHLIHRTVWLFKVGRSTQRKDSKIDRKTTSPFVKKGCVLLSQVNFYFQWLQDISVSFGTSNKREFNN